ncbi:MAG: hypothetical protein ABSB77_20165 [Xanthobacteraceae bacterium]|jgi:hypothetical protein
MAPMTYRQRSAMPLQHAALRVALAPTLVLLAGCSSLAGPQDGAATAPLNADYRSMIATRLKSEFTKSPLTGPAEISNPRWVLANKGWSWQVCVRFQDRGHQRTYALFFQGSEIIDERYAVLTDACDAQTYSEFDLGPGSMRPGAAGDPGPLY